MRRVRPDASLVGAQDLFRDECLRMERQLTRLEQQRAELRQEAANASMDPAQVQRVPPGAPPGIMTVWLGADGRRARCC